MQVGLRGGGRDVGDGAPYVDSLARTRVHSSEGSEATEIRGWYLVRLLCVCVCVSIYVDTTEYKAMYTYRAS